MAFSNRFSGHQRVAAPCTCPTSFFDEPRSQWQSSFHTERQDTKGKAWTKLLTLVENAASSGATEFAPGPELGPELWQQIVTLPPSIAALDRVQVMNLYGSNIHTIPPAIGEMSSLEVFTPYTSYRLHWFPYEITRCQSLRDSTVSTRALYGNVKYRPTFPQLSAELPDFVRPEQCSVCRTPAAPDALQQWWISLRVATDVLPLLAHVCSDECKERLGDPPENYVSVPHKGGTDLVQPHEPW